MTATVTEAYATCEDITRREAGNFYYGIRLLPAGKRAALCAVYALARRIDDIGDGDLPSAQKVTALAALRRELGDLEHSSDPVLTAVADAARRYPIPLGAFVEIVDGVEMDVTGRTYATFDELVTYCRCVAGSVGRLCLGVFGDACEPNRNYSGSKPDPRASKYADALGIALQQTNILRDIREDLSNGRVYLPQSDLDRFGVELKLDERGSLVDKEGELAALIGFSAERASQWYADGLRLMPLLDRRSAACCGAMAGIYSRLLSRIAADPTAVYDKRLSLSGWQKAGVAARALMGRSA
jgi:15-cis-phytoene synthase